MARERDLVSDFLQASTRAERSRKRRTWTIVAVVFGVVTTLALVATWFGFQTQQQSSELAAAATTNARRLIDLSTAQAETELERDIALSRQLAVQSVNELNTNNYELALLLAIEAGRVTDTKEAFTALRQILAQPGRTLMILPGDSAWWSPDGTHILTIDDGDFTIEDDASAQVWNMKTGEKWPIFFGHENNIRQVTWNPRRDEILAISNDNMVGVWNSKTGKELIMLDPKGDVNRASWNANGDFILVYTTDELSVWNFRKDEGIFEVVDTENIYAATWNPNENQILLTGEDAVVRVWNVVTGRVLHDLEHTANISQAIWSIDGKRILTQSEDNMVWVWDAKTGEEIYRFHHPDNIHQVIWNTNGNFIFTQDENNIVQLWDVKMKSELLSSESYTDDFHAEWNSSGDRVLFTTNIIPTEVQIWDTETGKITELVGNYANFAYWNADDTRIVTAQCDRKAHTMGSCLEGTVRIWDAETKQELVTLSGHTYWINEVKWNNDETLILTTSFDGTTRIWNIEESLELPTFLGHQGNVNYAMWNSTGTRILTSSADRTARVWDTRTGKELLKLTHTDTINQAVWNKTETYILTASDDDTARVWHADTGKELLVLNKHEDDVIQASWSDEESLILTASLDDTARVWNAETGKELIKLHHSDKLSSFTKTDRTDGVWRASWDISEARILTVSDWATRVWDAKTGRELLLLDFSDRIQFPLQWVTWRTGGYAQILAVSPYAGAQLWDVNTGIEVHTFGDHVEFFNDQVVLDAKFDVSGARVVTVGCLDTSGYEASINCNEGVMKVWNAETGKDLSIFSGIGESIYQLNFNKDGVLVVTVGCDRMSNPSCAASSARVWNIETQKELFSLSSHPNSIVFYDNFIRQAIWSVDGNRILIIRGRAIRQYYTNMEDLLIAACQQAPRNMTQNEWQRFMGDEPFRTTCHI